MTNGLAPLANYSIDPATGFVPSQDPLASLPRAFDAWEALVPNLPALIRARRVRAALEALPVLHPTPLAGEPTFERALLVLSVFANAYVWGGDTPALRLPPAVARPLVAVAAKLDRPPITHYASMALHNWQRIDPAKPIEAANARMPVQFLGGVDEEWFFLGSMDVELAGAPLLQTLYAAATQDDDDAALAALLTRAAGEMDPVLVALEKLRDWCDPYVFYHRVRGFVAGWPEPGVVYGGVGDAPQRYIGGSAGQSSLVQAIDAALGVVHDATTTGAYFRTLRGYMPVAHRNFVNDLERVSRIRHRVSLGGPALRDAYNEAVAQVDLFRRRHRALAHDYIFKPSGMSDAVRGTGGTSFTDFLHQAQRETAEARV